MQAAAAAPEPQPTSPAASHSPTHSLFSPPLQVWDIKSLGLPEGAPASGKPAKLRVTAAVAAHDKDINAVAVAPNDSGPLPACCWFVVVG